MLQLSIITINRNNAKGLRRTIESVINQTNNNFEYIIIDGASTDGSIQVIKDLLTFFSITLAKLWNRKKYFMDIRARQWHLQRHE